MAAPIWSSTQRIEMLVSALRVSGGNPVDGLPPARHTEAIAKLARLGPAENDKLMHFLLSLPCFDGCSKTTPRKSCLEYIGDLDKCVQM